MSRDRVSRYEGHDVLGATVALRNTGDGLSAAMAIEPIKLPQFSTVYVLVEAEVEKHRYDPIKDGGGTLTLVNMLKATNATIVPEGMEGDVKAALNDQAERIAAAAAKAAEDPTLLDPADDDAPEAA